MEENLLLDILYQDDYMVIINKPPGLLVHKSRIAADVKIFALQLLRDQLGQKVFPIHRLDRKTSGCLVFALDPETNAILGRQLEQKTIRKEYRAIVRGYLKGSDEIDYALTNDKGVTQDAVSIYEEIETAEINVPLGKHLTSRYTFVKLFPLTGRFHQLRKHMNHLRHPILGDRPHGCSKQNRLWKQKYSLDQMMLHARSITLNHPKTNEVLTVKAPYFGEFQRVAQILDISLD